MAAAALCLGALANVAIAQTETAPTEPTAHATPSSGDGLEDGLQAAPMVDEPAAEDDYPQWLPSARLISGVEWTTSAPQEGQFEQDSRQAFFVDQARLKLKVRLSKDWSITLSGDLDADPPVRSAFVQYRVAPWLKLRGGRFKRPMSRVELTSVGRLPFSERGHFNSQLIERAGWGDRALGVMAHGKLKAPRLRYMAAVMSAAPVIDVPRLEQRRGLDALGRLALSPIKPLTFAINGGHKLVEARAGGPNLSLFAVGGDVQWKKRGLRIVLEAMAAQNPFPPTPPTNADARTPWALNLMGIASYAIDLGGDLDLQPTVAADWVDTDLQVDEDTSLRVLVACNLRWRKTVRLMPQVALIRPLGAVGARSRVAQEVYRLAISVEP